MTAADLRAWRFDKRLTQTQAAEMLGYSLRQYAEIEARQDALPRRIELAATALMAEHAMKGAR